MKGWTIRDWRQAAANDDPEPALLAAHAQVEPRDAAWITLATHGEVRAQCAQLRARREAQAGSLEGLPLYGVPFAVKDNIDAIGFPTSAACPAFGYHPAADAVVVALLRAAGAVLFGKTNMDQFATGLVGTRSPYGAVCSAFDARYVGGGSSSGSASVVSRGVVPFALGTDTAGSGRVPAAFQNIVGIKPTCGALSTRGVVPACRTLDCVSVFALSVDDGAYVAEMLTEYDANNPYSRPAPREALHEKAPFRIAIPTDLEFSDQVARQAFERTLSSLQALEIGWQTVDFSPFRRLAQMLYEGPWLAERLLVVRDILASQPLAFDPIVRGIIEQGSRFSASDAFEAEYSRAALRQEIAAILHSADALLVPTTPTIFRLDQVAADPLGTNTKLGTYTNFTNLADLCALALPGLFRKDGLPSGITLIAPAWHDARLARIGRVFQDHLALPLGATERAWGSVVQEAPLVDAPLEMGRDELLLAVCGAHLSGMPLNAQLTSRRARFVLETRTAAKYRLYALPDTTPVKPGLIRASEGKPILVEVWGLPAEEWGGFLRELPPPLVVGNVELQDGRWVKGFLCEPHGLQFAIDITDFGGFRAFVKNGPAPSEKGAGSGYTG